MYRMGDIAVVDALLESIGDGSVARSGVDPEVCVSENRESDCMGDGSDLGVDNQNVRVDESVVVDTEAMVVAWTIPLVWVAAVGIVSVKELADDAVVAVVIAKVVADPFLEHIRRSFPD